MKTLLAALVVVSAIGCGGGGSGFSTSVPGSKPLGTLSTAEAKTLCTDGAKYAMSLASMENQCRAAGIGFAVLFAMGSAQTDAEIQAVCQAGYALCESPPADAGVDPTTAMDCADAMPAAATCVATVAQYTACVSETVAALQSFFIPCNQLTNAKLATFANDDGGAPTTGPACAAFEAACPGFDTTMSPLRSGSP